MQNIILVNSTNPLKKDYKPKHLILYKEYNGPKIDPEYQTLVPKKVYKAFIKMQKDAKKNNIFLIIDSAYRSYAYQEKVCKENLKVHGKRSIKTVAKPGTSEHQTGLAIDMALKRNGHYTDKFKDSDAEMLWLKENAHRYGFILRYPKNKEKITGIAYEYWHYRYVGKKHAQKIYNNNLTLEEYVEKIGIESGKSRKVFTSKVARK